MKILILLTTLFAVCLTKTKAQINSLDPTFGNKGIVKTDMGAILNHNVYGNQVEVHNNHFLINDDEPLLYHVGLKQMFALLLEALSKIISPSKLL